MCPKYTTCNHKPSDSHPSSIPQPGHSPRIIRDLSRPQIATTSISKRIQTLNQMIIYKSTKHQTRIIQTPTQNHRKFTTDILDGIPTSLKQHPTACSKSSTHHRTTGHISSKSEPRTTQTSPQTSSIHRTLFNHSPMLNERIRNQQCQRIRNQSQTSRASQTT